MLKNENPYTVRIEESDGIKRYYISFTDGCGILQETEVEKDVFNEIEKYRKHEKRQLNFFDRHIEHSELTDESLQEQTARPPVSLEESAIMRDRESALRIAVAELPEIQRQRFLLYFMYGLTFEQISEQERCTKMAVKYTVDKAKAVISKNLKDFN